MPPSATSHRWGAPSPPASRATTTPRAYGPSWRSGHRSSAASEGSVVRHPFGWTGVPVPVIGLGTWNLERADRAEALTALRQGLDAGLTHIDTAEMYGRGWVEEMRSPPDDAIAERGQHLLDGLAELHVGVGVVRRLRGREDRRPRPRPRGDGEHLVHRSDDERRPGGDEEIGCGGCTQRAREVRLDERLPEGDGRRLPGPAARASRHRRAPLPELLRRRALGAPVARHALDLGVRAVDVHEPLGRKSAPLVEPVDVLRDEQLDVARVREVGERLVGSVRLGRADQLPGLALVAPVPDARLLVGEEVVQRNGLVPLPATARRAEVGDSRRGREAGAGQHDDAARAAPGVGEGVEGGVHVFSYYRLINW